MKFFFSGIGLMFTLLIVIISVVSAWLQVPDEFNRAAILGVGLSLVFVTGGFISYLFALKFRQKAFNKVVGISILGRLLLMAISIVLILLLIQPDQVVFLISMFISYFLFQIWEVISFNKIAAKKV